MFRLLVLCVLLAGCGKEKVDVAALKLIGTPATVVGKMLRLEPGQQKTTCYLIVEYKTGHRLEGKQEPAWTDEIVYNHAKTGNTVYVGQNGVGTTMILEYLE